MSTHADRKLSNSWRLNRTSFTGPPSRELHSMFFVNFVIQEYTIFKPVFGRRWLIPSLNIKSILCTVGAFRQTQLSDNDLPAVAPSDSRGMGRRLHTARSASVLLPGPYRCRQHVHQWLVREYPQKVHFESCFPCIHKP